MTLILLGMTGSAQAKLAYLVVMMAGSWLQPQICTKENYVTHCKQNTMHGQEAYMMK
jgi:uncharacterized membrane protein YuzA (DUF378 family)